MSDNDKKEIKSGGDEVPPPKGREVSPKGNDPHPPKDKEVNIHPASGTAQRSVPPSVRQSDSWAVSNPTHSRAMAASKPQRSERDVVRDKLRQAGVLATNLGVPRNVAPISDEELERVGNLPPGARSSEDLVSEDRGD